MREVVLDTETTGLDPLNGDRVVEIGLVELFNQVPTGRTFQTYLYPERAMDPDAERVSGITDEMLKDKPLFTDVADAFLEFIGDSPLVIHNAAFDLGFLNMELERSGRPRLDPARAIDTVVIARKKFPGARVSLDALCQRFNIDLSKRTKHGALLDSELLAQVYLELRGGRQTDLGLAGQGANAARAGANQSDLSLPGRPAPRAARPEPLKPRISAEEEQAHDGFIAGLKGDVIWKWPA